MQHRSTVRTNGFSLLEMMIAMALGAVVMAAAAEMFSRAVRGTFTVSQRAEMQQDFRAASNMLTKDASMAGAGFTSVALPYGAGSVVPVYGCDQTPKCYINGGAVAYPTQLVNADTVPYVYGLVPGPKFGPIVNAAGGPTDVLTVANADTTFLLSCYNTTVTSAVLVTFVLPNPLPQTCVVPPPLLAPQKIDDPALGLTPGDLVRFQITNAGNSSTVLGEVTKVTNVNATTWTVGFAAGDPLRMNQPAAAKGSLGTMVGGTGSADRINVISYYIDNSIVPPRLMRQTSGHTPIPLAENVAFLQFSYDLYDTTAGAPLINQDDGGASKGLTPSQITKINIKHMSIASTLHGTTGYQGLDLQTSVSARDLTFKDDYPTDTAP
jgi:prepilin-type N-terminal cleavage/methylation domain-containing protein